MFRGLLTDYRRNDDAAVVVEFAIFLPILLALFVGAVSMFDAYRMSYRAAEAAAIVSDLASRYTIINDDDVEDLYQTADAVMGSSTARSSIDVRILSVAHWPNSGPRGGACPGREMPNNGCLTVAWVAASQSANPPDVDDLILPEIPRGESVIQARVAVKYDYIFSMFGDEFVSVNRTSTRRPRFTNEVTYGG